MSLPEGSPLAIVPALCQKCTKPMRPTIQTLKNGKIIGVTYYCDSEGCKYGWETSAPVVNGLHTIYNQSGRHHDHSIESHSIESHSISAPDNTPFTPPALTGRTEETPSPKRKGRTSNGD